MQFELPAIDRWEEVLAQPRIQQANRHHPERHNRQQEDSPVLQAKRKYAVIPVANLFKIMLERDLESGKWIAARPRLLRAIMFMALQ